MMGNTPEMASTSAATVIVGVLRRGAGVAAGTSARSKSS
jgi:hypothetical protein